jgi:hypothetical protein
LPAQSGSWGIASPGRVLARRVLKSEAIGDSCCPPAGSSSEGCSRL